MTIYYLGAADPLRFGEFFRGVVLPRLESWGARPLGFFETEPAGNNFPRLPVRERESVFTWLARWTDASRQQRFVERFRSVSGWRDEASGAVLPALMRKPEVLRLMPTSRSALQ